MAGRVKLLMNFFNFIYLMNYVQTSENELVTLMDDNVMPVSALAFWPNATVPFFIEKEHFDAEQSVSILTALSLFAFKTCLKFSPVLARPAGGDHVLVLENPAGGRKCSIRTDPHAIDEPHYVTLGYDCLKSPDIDMMIMKALGFPFEHNRAVRDIFIEVQTENVEPGYLDLFVKDLRQPMELRVIPYDVNSVMHFDQRAFSSNGHRTIIFKKQNVRQERLGLSPLDLRKIDVVYGPECQKRDRQEKIELCQNYPGVARKKRETTDIPRSLRVNPAITPPANIAEDSSKNDTYNKTALSTTHADAAAATDGAKNDADDNTALSTTYTDALIEQLQIGKEVERFINHINKISSRTLSKARVRLCQNGTKKSLRIGLEKPKILDIIGQLVSYENLLVEKATQNLTEFCADSASMSDYQRSSCPFFDKRNCPRSYKSTKSGPVKYSTQHRPVYQQSTRPEVQHARNQYMKLGSLRKGNSSEDAATPASEAIVTAPVTPGPKHERSKREADFNTVSKESVRSEKVKHNNHTDSASSASASTEVDTKDKRGADKEELVESNLNKEKVAVGKKDIIKGSGQQRRFKAQKFWSKKHGTNRPNQKRLKEEWDFSGVSMEKEPQEGSEDSDAQSESVTRLYQSQESQSRHAAKRSGDAAPGVREAEELVDRPQPDSESRIPSRDKHNFGEDETGPRLRSRVQDNERKPKPRGHKAKESHIDDHQGSNEENSNEESSEVKKVKKMGRLPVEHHEDEETTSSKKQTEGPREPLKAHKAPKLRKPSRPAEPPQSGESNEAPEAQEAQQSGLPRIVNLPKPTREFYDERKWPDGVVRYVIEDTGDAEVDIADVRKRLAEVARQLEERTCARLQELTRGSADKFEDYLVLDASPDYVTGRVGGKQNFGVVELLRGGQHRQHAAMVVMAMLGFYFEVARHDRDKHIRVHMRNVRADKLHHFEKIREDATFPLPYDYKSATHPAWQFWRQIDKVGISTVATFKKKDPDGSIMRSLGQNIPLLSELDVVKINSVYGIECFKQKQKGRKIKQIEKKEKELEEDIVNDKKDIIEEKEKEVEKESEEE